MRRMTAGCQILKKQNQTKTHKKQQQQNPNAEGYYQDKQENLDRDHVFR